ncbi:DUF72 domain-containing protein [Portibacter marinus]|uniref:DUF72 domain-containing protein n=1 Tax=Portibacter marinus TaxID=2898660 RepID=UPI001F474D7F|nr:DUF72 domain-containing protein [Portibacter marinus]
MKFGKLENIDQVDFTLPEDRVIFEADPSDSIKIYTGATSWNKNEWKGVLYPEKAKKADFIRHYGKQFNSIELNATHYRTPSDQTIETWVNETPDDFRFCPKVLQAISHRHNMLSNENLVNNFIVQLSKLGKKMGQTFLQLPPYFKYESLPYLKSFLKSWPEEIPLAIELRNEEMHNNENYFEAYIDILSQYHCTPLITDVSGRRDLMHMTLNGPKVFIRWVGNGLHPSDYARILEWKERIKTWKQYGVQEVYFMLHEPDNLKTPEIAEIFSKELENIQYIDQRGPKLIQEQPNLFS